MAQQAREATGIEDLTVVPYCGYFKGDEIPKCEQAGITTYLPKPLTSNSKADGCLGKQDFVYVLENKNTAVLGLELDLSVHEPRSRPDHTCLLDLELPAARDQGGAPTCLAMRAPLGARGTDAMQRRLYRETEKMRQRRRTVEHPFGTIKHWMGSTHFLTKAIGRVSTEMNLCARIHLKRDAGARDRGNDEGDPTGEGVSLLACLKPPPGRPRKPIAPSFGQCSPRLCSFSHGLGREQKYAVVQAVDRAAAFG